MKKNIIQWLKDNHSIIDAKDVKYSISQKIYCGTGNYLYDIDVEYIDIDGDDIKDTLYIFISKNFNNTLNRMRGSDNNKSSNNGVGLHYYNIEYYLWNNGTKYINIAE